LPDEDLKIAGHILNQLGILSSNIHYIQKDNPLINFSLKEFTDIIYYFMKRTLVANFEKPLPIKKFALYENIHQLCCDSLLIFEQYPLNYKKWIERMVEFKRILIRRTINGYFHFYHPAISSELSPRCISFIYKTFYEMAGEILKKNSKPYIDTFFGELINEKDLAEQLELRPSVVSKLVKCRDIPIYKTEITDNKTENLFEADIFLRIMEQVRTNLEIQDTCSEDSQMNLNQIYRHFSGNIHKFCKFLRLVLQGKIKPCSEDLDADGLHRFLYRAQDIKA
jgi:hypothetical protein